MPLIDLGLPMPRTRVGRAFLEWIDGYGCDVPVEACWEAILEIEESAVDEARDRKVGEIIEKYRPGFPGDLRYMVRKVLGLPPTP